MSNWRNNLRRLVSRTSGRDSQPHTTASPSVPRSRAQFAADEDGRTELMRAAGRGDMREVQAIIFSTSGTGLGSGQRLSLIDRTDREGRTALDYARDAGHEAVLGFLQGEKSRIELFE